jgi:hypothetical protein
LPSYIDRQVVDPAVDMAQRNLGLEYQGLWRCGACRCGADACEGESREEGDSTPAGVRGR